MRASGSTFFRGRPTPEVERLDALLGEQEIIVGDLILAEVLQGFAVPKAFELAHLALAKFPLVGIGGAATAIAAARNFHALRARGITARTIDTMIATRCILDSHALLSSDRDFAPFVTHLGLRSAMEAR